MLARSTTCEIPDLSSWPLQRFPCLAFSVPDHDRIDIRRVQRAGRDIPTYPWHGGSVDRGRPVQHTADRATTDLEDQLSGSIEQPMNHGQARISNHLYLAVLLEPAIWGADPTGPMRRPRQMISLGVLDDIKEGR